MLFVNERFGRVCHLAAQAGVRYSITNPRAYIPDFVNVSPKNHLQIMGRYVDVVS